MTDLRQAAQALLNRWDSPLWKNGSTADAIADLRTALEQKAEPVAAESITDAMMNLVDRLGSEWKQVDLRAWQHLLVYAPQQQAEPVASIYVSLDGAREFDDWKHELPVGRNFLYTAALQRKPLTKEQRLVIVATAINGHASTREAILWAIEYVERHHGIKEGT